MKRFIAIGILAIAMFVPGISFAGHWGDQPERKMITENGGSPVIITTSHCVNELVTQYIKPATLSQFYAGTILYLNKTYALCYVITTLSDGQDYVLVVDEEGESGTIPYILFSDILSI